MKTMMTLILSFSLSSAFAVTVEDCLKEAVFHGNHTSPSSPDTNCAASVAASSEKVSVSTLDGSIKVYGQGQMVYIEKYESESMVSRDLLAGDQTALTTIKSMTINPTKKRLVIVQQGDEAGTEVLTFNLDFIGNVAPITMLKSDVAQNASKAELKDSVDEVALTFNSLGKVKFYSSEADSRYKDEQSKFIPTLLRETPIP